VALNLVKSKTQWRTQLREARGHWKQNPNAVAQINGRLQELLVQYPGPIAAYCAHDYEVELDSLTKANPEREWVYPVTESEQLRFFSPNQWRAGAFGIREPDPQQSSEVALQNCAAVLVPGLAFDRRGMRLGRGGGLYDRALVGYSGKKIGVAYGAQVLREDLPVEAHDQRMDFVVTENFILQTLV
jgi:5-formyltetrahydrofolate cyclo-ligase